MLEARTGLGGVARWPRHQVSFSPRGSSCVLLELFGFQKVRETTKYENEAFVPPRNEIPMKVS
jgi:hypothetical protein